MKDVSKKLCRSNEEICREKEFNKRFKNECEY